MEALEFEGAFVQGGGVAVYADGEFEGHLVLAFDDFRERAVVRFALGVVVGNYALQLLNEPPDDHGAKSEEEEKGGQKEPAVIHAGGVINRIKKLSSVHICHGVNSLGCDA